MHETTENSCVTSSILPRTTIIANLSYLAAFFMQIKTNKKLFQKNYLTFNVNLVYNNGGDKMKSYENVITLYFKSLEAFNEFERIPRKFGTGDLLYHSEIHTLQAIGSHKNINLTDLSERLNISKSGTSKFITKLLKKNLITKNKLFNNQKEVVFNLTEKGSIAYKAHEKFSKETFESIYSLLSRLKDDQLEFLESFLSDLTLCVEDLYNKNLN